MRFFWGLFGIIIGTLVVWKTYPIVSFTGKFDWAERVFSGGFGGTYFFLKLAGIVVIIFSIMYMFGLSNLLFSPLRGIFGGLAGK